MFKKTVTFPDLDGNPVTEDFYFNFSQAELLELEATYPGGLSGLVEEIQRNKNGGDVIRLFKELMVKSIGRRSADGRRFIKNQEILDDFLQTEAYSTLFMELIDSPTSGSDFFMAIFPKDLLDKAQAQAQVAAEANATTDVKLPVVDETPWITENRDATPAEVRRMTPEQMRDAYLAKATREQIPNNASIPDA